MGRSMTGTKVPVGDQRADTGGYENEAHIQRRNIRYEFVTAAVDDEEELKTRGGRRPVFKTIEGFPWLYYGHIGVAVRTDETFS